MELGVIVRGLFKRADLTRLDGLVKGLIVNDNPEYKLQLALSDISAKVADYHAYHDWQATHWHPCIAQVLSLDLQMQCLIQPQSGVPLIGLVHVANRIQWLGPVSAKDTEVTCQIQSYKLHRKGVVLTLRTVLKQENEVQVIADSDYLCRCSIRDPGDSLTHSAKAATSQSAYKSFVLGEEVGRRYAQISGDYNPIHMWPITAKLFGFSRPIAHGMHTLALCLSARYQHQHEWPGKTQLNANFKAPAALPCELQMLCDSKGDIASACSIQLSDPKLPEANREVLNLIVREI